MNLQRKLIASVVALMLAGWGGGGLSLASGQSVVTGAASRSSPRTSAASETETYTGTFGIIWGDGSAGSGLTAETYWLSDGAGLPLRLDLTPELAQPWGGPLALNGRRLTVTGTRAAVSAQADEVDVLQVQSLEPAAGVGTADLGTQAVTGSQPWVTIMCKFPDRPASSTGLSYFQGMYGTTYPTLDHYWRELSYNNINVVGSNAVGWYTLPQPRSYYVPSGSLSFSRAANDCTALANAAVDFRPFVGINLMFNDIFDTVNNYAWGGSQYLTLDGVSRSWRMTWEPPWGWQNISVIEHEMGHGFGLPHSSGMYGATYDNKWDVMSDTWGNCSSKDPTYGCMGQHTIAPYKDQLGWIGTGQKTTLPYQGQTTLTLEQLAQPQTSNYLLARISTCDSSRNYSVEARRRVGYDSILPGEGIIIHKVQNGYAYVVDTNPQDILNKSTSHANFSPGSTYTNTTDMFTVTVDSATSTGYVVTITNTAPCTPPDPPTLLAPAAGAFRRQRLTGFFWQPSASLNQTYVTLRVNTSPNPDTSPLLVNNPINLPAAAYTYTFSADGTYYWHARSTNTGNLNSTWVSRTVTIDTVNPTAAFTLPTVSNAYLNVNNITVRATVSDALSGVDHVEFSAGYDAPTTWLALGSDTDGSDGWSYPLDANAQGITDQTTLAFRIKAYDRAGNSTQVDATGITLDSVAPVSAVNSLSATSPALFTVAWGGTDATSGVASYDVQYQVNDSGPWFDWRTSTTLTQALFVSSGPGKYAFRCRAADRAGNMETWPGSADASTTVASSPVFVYLPVVAGP
jgi:M6 family metalloprotease-like protein